MSEERNCFPLSPEVFYNRPYILRKFTISKSLEGPFSL